MAGVYQKDRFELIVDSGSGMCKVGFAGYYGFRFMFPSVVGRLEMLGIMSGTHQKDSYALLVVSGSGTCNVIFTGWLVSSRRTVMWCVFKVVNIPVVAQRLSPMVQTVLRTIEIPQLLLHKVVDAPGMQVVVAIFSLSWRRGFPRSRLCSWTRRRGWVQPVQQTIEITQLPLVPGGQCSCFAGRASSTGAGCG